jgi:DNA-binding MltR family transcriptional regulator
VAQKIFAVEALSAESKALHEAMNNEPDFPCVLIAASFLDQCLASLLERFFIESPVSTELLRGTLGTFSSRAKLCCALGLIPESLMKNLLKVGEIRNKFAHSYLSLSFEDPGITDLCKSVSFPEISQWVGADLEAGDPWAQFQGPRVKFTLVVTSMASRLLLFGLGAERRQKQSRGWC